MKSEPATTTTFVPRVLSYVAAHGGDVAALATRFGLPEDARSRPSLELSAAKIGGVSDAAAAMLADPFLGLHIGISEQNRLPGLLGGVAANAPTVGACLERIIRYQALMKSPTVLRLLRGPRDFSIVYEQQIPGFDPGRHNVEFAITKVVHGIREVSREHVIPCRIAFSHAAPARITPLVDFFGTDRITFSADASAVSFDREVLDLPVVGARPELSSVLDKMADDQLASASDRDLLGKLRLHIRRALGAGGAPTLELLAPAVAMSPRTLQRRLQEHDLTFHGFLDEVRRELAVHYLRHVGMDVDSVAEALGYAQPEAFSRAFKRWLGTTPGAYRSERSYSSASGTRNEPRSGERSYSSASGTRNEPRSGERTLRS
jgi:AraC-like DNA-binding protein